jgi:hypothetical protein
VRAAHATTIRAQASAKILSLLRGVADPPAIMIGGPSAVAEERGPRQASSPALAGWIRGRFRQSLFGARPFELAFPSPLGRGCLAAGAFTSRSEAGEGFVPPMPLRRSPGKPSRCPKEPPIDDVGKCRGTYEGPRMPFGNSLFARCHPESRFGRGEGPLSFAWRPFPRPAWRSAWNSEGSLPPIPLRRSPRKPSRGHAGPPMDDVR